MKDIEIAVDLQCRCGNDIVVHQSVPVYVTALADLKFECAKCETKYFIMIQEVKSEKRSIESARHQVPGVDLGASKEEGQDG